jgi:hypothetical protein
MAAPYHLMTITSQAIEVNQVTRGLVISVGIAGGFILGSIAMFVPM